VYNCNDHGKYYQQTISGLVHIENARHTKLATKNAEQLRGEQMGNKEVAELSNKCQTKTQMEA